jgi:hypothetical protein
MLLRDDLTCLRCELAADFSAPRAIFESLVRPRCSLDRGNIFPVLVVSWSIDLKSGRGLCSAPGSSQAIELNSLARIG